MIRRLLDRVFTLILCVTMFVAGADLWGRLSEDGLPHGPNPLSALSERFSRGFRP